MSRSYSTEPSTYWDQGWYPQMSLWAYTVGHDSSGYRTLTRDSSRDIPADYIEHESIRYTAQNIPGDILEGGAVVPGHLTFNLLPGYQYTYDISATPAASTTHGYSRVYELIIMFTNGTSYGAIYRLGGRFVVTGKSNTWNNTKIKLTLDEEHFIFDNLEYDLASKTTMTYRDVVGNIFAAAGFRPSDIFDSTEILAGTNIYTGAPMSARQALSYILQLNGCSLLQRGQYFYIRWVSHEALGGTWPADYSGDYKYGDHSGVRAAATIITSDAPQRTGNIPGQLIVKGNPLVTSGNASAYIPVLMNRVCWRTHRGIEVDYMLDPTIEPGDCLLYLYVMTDAEHTTGINQFILNRFEWNGGMYCKLSEAVYDPINRA